MSYEKYQELLQKNIEELRQENGTYRASWSEEYNATWIRDNFWCNMSNLHHNKEKYIQTAQTHLDFLKKYETEYDHKISWLIKDNNVQGKLENMRRFIHPKVNFDGTEIEGMKWNFIQLDTLPYYILMMYYGWKNGMEIFRDKEDREMIQLVIKVIEAMDICNRDFGSAWEEECSQFTSNIGLCMRALEAGYEMGFDINQEELRKIRRKFWGMFPLERHGRTCDLTLLFLCAIDGVLKPVDIDNVMENVAKELHRDYFCCRYSGDKYKPFDRTMDCNDHRQPCKGEMQWCMSAGYLAITCCKINNNSSAKHYIDKLVELYPDGLIPEGINEKGEPCVNSPLCWSMAMASLGIDAINGKFIQ